MTFNIFEFLNHCTVSPELKRVIDDMVQLTKSDAKELSLQASKEFEQQIIDAIQTEINAPVNSPTLPDIKNSHYTMTKGVLLWSMLDRSIGKVLYDSYQSRYLARFSPVREFTDHQLLLLNETLKNQYQLNDQELERVRSEVDYITSNLTIKNGICEYITEQLAAGLEHGQLFRFLTGYRVLENQPVDVTLTQSTLFFTFDFDQDGLYPPQQYSLCEQSEIKDLFAEI
jgi:hypothetical protein